MSLKVRKRQVDEKIDSAYYSLDKGNTSVVGDLAIKVVESAIEMHAMKYGKGTLGGHRLRFEYVQENFGLSMRIKMAELFRIYGDLGYDGKNGENAKRAIELMEDILPRIEEKIDVKFQLRRRPKKAL